MDARLPHNPSGSGRESSLSDFDQESEPTNVGCYHQKVQSTAIANAIHKLVFNFRQLFPLPGGEGQRESEPHYQTFSATA